MAISIGMTVYNGERHLKEAISSILNQTHKDFTLNIVDDGSSDMSWRIISDFAQEDDRINAYRNTSRMGAIYTWRKVFDFALAQNPQYFAWASDHDLWGPTWLETLNQAIEDDNNIALVYPKTIRIDDYGHPIQYKSPEFETNGLVNLNSRIASLRKSGNGYGDMIYGLFRVAALKSSGVYRRILLPDTVTIWEVSFWGTIRQVDKYLWYRRYIDLFSIKRQRRSLFVTPPWYTYLPYWIVNPLFILIRNNLPFNNQRQFPQDFLSMLIFSLSYGVSFGIMELKRSAKLMTRGLLSIVRPNEK